MYLYIYVFILALLYVCMHWSVHTHFGGELSNSRPFCIFLVPKGLKCKLIKNKKNYEFRGVRTAVLNMIVGDGKIRISAIVVLLDDTRLTVCTVGLI